MFKRLEQFSRFSHLPRYQPLLRRIAQIEQDLDPDSRRLDFEDGAEDHPVLRRVQKIFSTSEDVSDHVIVATSLIPGAGKGLFASKLLPRFACVGTFWGYDPGWGEVSPYAALHEPADVTSSRLWPEFAKCPVLYLNEPPLECEASCGWGPMEVDESTGQLLHQRIYTLREVEPGEELFLYYGSCYAYRSYPVNLQCQMQRLERDTTGEWIVCDQ